VVQLFSATLHAMRLSIVLGTVMLLFASAFGMAGYFILRRGLRLRAKGCATDGVIVGYEQRRVEYSTSFYPKVEFQALDGQKYIFRASNGGGRMPTIGRRVRVRYYPNDPDDADIASFGGIPYFSVLMFLFAFGFLSASLIFYSGLADNQ